MAAGFAVGLIPAAPATAAFNFRSRNNVTERDYATCADRLLEKGVAETTAASACARALYPLELSRCVGGIGNSETLAATEILSACQRVRRPLELATCYNEIEGGDDAAPSAILDHCRRSLLPERFSSCVVGIRQETTLSTTSAMRSCIDAGDTPVDAADTPTSDVPTLTPL